MSKPRALVERIPVPNRTDSVISDISEAVGELSEAGFYRDEDFPPEALDLLAAADFAGIIDENGLAGFITTTWDSAEIARIPNGLAALRDKRPFKLFSDVHDYVHAGNFIVNAWFGKPTRGEPDPWISEKDDAFHDLRPKLTDAIEARAKKLKCIERLPEVRLQARMDRLIQSNPFKAERQAAQAQTLSEYAARNIDRPAIIRQRLSTALNTPLERLGFRVRLKQPTGVRWAELMKTSPDDAVAYYEEAGVAFVTSYPGGEILAQADTSDLPPLERYPPGR